MNELLEADRTLSFVVQPSDTRIVSDAEYLSCGATISNNLSDCDLIFGVKEPSPASLLNNKHYFFFGHLDDKPPYNKALFRALSYKGITFTDYELIKDRNGKRKIAFGYWAGLAGAYNTLRLYGLKYGYYELPKLDATFTKQRLFSNLTMVKDVLSRHVVKILIIGDGRVSRGAREVMDTIGIKYEPACKFKFMVNEETCYSIVNVSDLTFDTYGYQFDRAVFASCPERFSSRFFPYAEVTDILLCCHTYQFGAPVYLDERLVRGSKNRIRIVGDITCDVNGSVVTTTRYSTHDKPFYDINQNIEEVPLFEDVENISVMAVDNLPNALAREASEGFSDMLKEVVFGEKGLEEQALKDATMFINGSVTDNYKYLYQYLWTDGTFTN